MTPEDINLREISAAGSREQRVTGRYHLGRDLEI
jgi:hypothetical protein